MYTEEEKTIHYVFKVFEGKKRKKEDIDLAFHSIMVGNMLKEASCNKKTIIAGYLHDVIEDTDKSYDDLVSDFGKDTADMVKTVSEDTSIKDYRLRKEEFLKKIENSNEDILNIEIADKLQNLISDYSGFCKNGRDFLMTNNTSYVDTRWFYRELQIIFNKKIDNNMILLKRFNDIVDLYFK